LLFKEHCMQRYDTATGTEVSRHIDRRDGGCERIQPRG
jgi:hypothetical protein